MNRGFLEMESMCCQSELTILNMKKKYNRIVIYGAGNKGTYFLSCLHEFGVTKANIEVWDAKSDGKTVIHGFETKNPNFAKSEDNCNALAIIALCSKKNNILIQEVMHKLVEAGYRNIYSYLDIMECTKNDLLMDIRSEQAKKEIDRISRYIRPSLFLSIFCIGGSTYFLDEQVEETVHEERIPCIVIKYNYFLEVYHAHYISATKTIEFASLELQSVLETVCSHSFDAIYVNNLVGFPGLYDCLDLLIKAKLIAKSKLVFYLHDFYSICPTIVLVDINVKYCDIPCDTICQQCFYEKNFHSTYGSMKQWRMRWAAFLSQCDHVVCFSDSSASIFGKAFNSSELSKKLVINPHRVTYMQKVDLPMKTTKILTIGFLGYTNLLKGSRIIKEMAKLIDSEDMGIRLVLIGSLEGDSNLRDYKYFTQTGKYAREEIATLTRSNEIDIFFITSIWPETFSYTTQEVIEMGMPVACFDIGAQAERVSRYSKGLVISEVNARHALVQIQEFMQNLSPKVDSSN